jgi:hypothetical protein
MYNWSFKYKTTMKYIVSYLILNFPFLEIEF